MKHNLLILMLCLWLGSIICIPFYAEASQDEMTADEIIDGMKGLTADEFKKSVEKLEGITFQMESSNDEQTLSSQRFRTQLVSRLKVSFVWLAAQGWNIRYHVVAILILFAILLCIRKRNERRFADAKELRKGKKGR